MEVDCFKMEKSSGFVVVADSALPEVIIKVLHAKELRAASQQMSSSEACRIVGISRSAYYKYKDSVFRYNERGEDSVMLINMLLSDRQGVLSAVISKLYELGVNIIEINQNPPVDGVAAVSISVQKENRSENSADASDTAGFSEILSAIDGVLDVKIAAGKSKMLVNK